MTDVGSRLRYLQAAGRALIQQRAFSIFGLIRVFLDGSVACSSVVAQN